MRDQVAVVGVGCTKFGELFEQSYEDLICEAAFAAYDSPTWEAAHLLIFFSIPMLVLGLPVLHRLLSSRVGTRLSTFAVAASTSATTIACPPTAVTSSQNRCTKSSPAPT